MTVEEIIKEAEKIFDTLNLDPQKAPAIIALAQLMMSLAWYNGFTKPSKPFFASQEEAQNFVRWGAILKKPESDPNP